MTAHLSDLVLLLVVGGAWFVGAIFAISACIDYYLEER